MSNLKTLKSALVGISLLASGVVMAGDQLDCPAGTNQSGSASTGTGIVGCVDSNGKFQGPYLAYSDDGKLVASGTMKDSFHEGKSTFFDASGKKSGETDFRRSRYHGKRVTYFQDGRVKSERNYVNGLLEGSLREYDAKGSVVRAEEFKADRKVASAK